MASRSCSWPGLFQCYDQEEFSLSLFLEGFVGFSPGLIMPTQSYRFIGLLRNCKSKPLFFRYSFSVIQSLEQFHTDGSSMSPIGQPELVKWGDWAGLHAFIGILRKPANQRALPGSDPHPLPARTNLISRVRPASLMKDGISACHSGTANRDAQHGSDQTSGREEAGDILELLLLIILEW